MNNGCIVYKHWIPSSPFGGARKKGLRERDKVTGISHAFNNCSLLPLSPPVHI